MAYMGKSVERDMYFGAKSYLFELSERMRKHPTKAEQKLWQHLRSFRKEGFVFRRQHPLDFFIADFYCHKVKLVIEVDGDVHLIEEQAAYDDSRSGELERFGIRVIRFDNKEVLENTNTVINRIKLIIDEMSSPSLLGEGD